MFAIQSEDPQVRAGLEAAWHVLEAAGGDWANQVQMWSPVIYETVNAADKWAQAFPEDKRAGNRIALDFHHEEIRYVLGWSAYLAAVLVQEWAHLLSYAAGGPRGGPEDERHADAKTDEFSAIIGWHWWRDENDQVHFEPLHPVPAPTGIVRLPDLDTKDVKG